MQALTSIKAFEIMILAKTTKRSKRLNKKPYMSIDEKSLKLDKKTKKKIGRLD